MSGLSVFRDIIVLRLSYFWAFVWLTVLSEITFRVSLANNKSHSKRGGGLLDKLLTLILFNIIVHALYHTYLGERLVLDLTHWSTQLWANGCFLVGLHNNVLINCSIFIIN